MPLQHFFDHGATYDFCRVTLAFNIREGDIEGTDIAGRKVVLIADTPKVMTEGNWRLGVYIDDGASDEQFDKLVKVFGGQLGGPMGALAPLVGEVVGVERAAIEFDDDGLRHSVRVGDTIDFEIQDIVPFGVETGEPVRFQRHVPPGRLRPDHGRGQAHPHQRLRHLLRGQDRSVQVRVLLGRLTRWRRRSAHGEHAGLGPAYAAARARLGLVAALFAIAALGWVWTAHEMRGMDAGPWTSLGSARLVPRHLGRDDGGDDVPVGRADDRAVHPNHEGQVAALTLAVRRRLPAHLGRGRTGGLRRGRPAVAAFGDTLAWGHDGRTLAGATLRRRRHLRAHPAQERVPRQVPQPPRRAPGLVAGRAQAVPCGWGCATAPGASDAAGR